MTIASFNLRVDVADPVPEQLEGLLAEGEAWVELDVGSRIVGFDRNGVATIVAGEEVKVTGRLCGGELSGPLGDVIELAA